MADRPEPPDEEVLYAPPRTSWGAYVGAALLVAGIGWLVARMFRGVAPALAAFALMLAAALALALRDRGSLLRARRVVADHRARALRIEHGLGRVTAVPYDQIETAAAGLTTAGEGLALDTVTVTARGGARVTFVALDRAAAEGAARAILAVAARLDSPRGDDPERPPSA